MFFVIDKNGFPQFRGHNSTFVLNQENFITGGKMRDVIVHLRNYVTWDTIIEEK